MGRSTTARARNGNNEITVQDHQTDAPLLPIPQLEKLHQFRPDLVDWVFTETKCEGDFRRREVTRVNTLVFTERILGLIAGLVIGVVALLAAVYLAMNDREVVAGVIGGTTVVGLVSVFVVGAIKAPVKGK